MTEAEALTRALGGVWRGAKGAPAARPMTIEARA